MPPQSDLFQSALKALEQKRYSEAIDLLEMFEKMSFNLQAEQYLKIRMGLIEAYFQSGQKEKAMQLCQHLAANKNPEVQAWVKNMLALFSEFQQTQQEETDSSLSTSSEVTQQSNKIETQKEIKPCQKNNFVETQSGKDKFEVTPITNPSNLTPEQLEKLFNTGKKAFRKGNYTEAIKAFEEFCFGTSSNHSKYYAVQKDLAKAYQAENQTEKAVVLCQEIINGAKEIDRIWAQKFLTLIVPDIFLQTPLLSTNASVTESVSEQPAEELTETKIKLKSLTDFKRYCEKNLISELKKYEKKRKETLITVAFSSIFALIIAIFALKGSWAVALEIKKGFTSSYKSQSQAVVIHRNNDLTPPSRRIRHSPSSLTNENNNSTSPTRRMRRSPSSLNNENNNSTPPTRRIKRSPSSLTNENNNLTLPTRRMKVRHPKLRWLFLSLAFYLAILFGDLIIWVIFYSSCTSIYSQDFKYKIIGKIINFIDEKQHLTYAEYSLPEQTHQTHLAFIHSQLFQKSAETDKIRQSDLVYGKIGKTDIVFSDVYAMSEFYHYWLAVIPSNRALGLVINLIIKLVKGVPYAFSRVIQGKRLDHRIFNEEVINNTVSRKIFFKGLFFRASFNKNFLSKTVVIPNHLGTKIQFLSSQKGELIKLEDPEFNRLFTVYSDDQIESRYILSTNLISRLVEFSKKANRKVYISFIDSTIYIAIKYDHDLFEPKLFKSMMTFTPMREYFENLQLMLGIVEDLSLNRRIWSA